MKQLSMRVLASTWLLICGAALICRASHAATIYVPDDYPQIGQAIAAAQTDDEIVVKPGTYVTGGMGISKRIMLRSTFDGLDWSIVENTIIRKSSSSGAIIELSIAGTGSTIRGFTITRPVIDLQPGANFSAEGILSDGRPGTTIEFNIIENCVKVRGFPPAFGGAIAGVDGVIQGNIIRNNIADAGSAIGSTKGLIRNNVIYNTNGYSVSVDTFGPIQFVNNTVYSSTGGGVSIAGSSVNNIVWAEGLAGHLGQAPTNCIIKGYTGPGTNIITDDPQFVDPANGDFRLMPTSPAIDAGAVVAGVTADFFGVQRGLKANPALPGAGPFYDIGAHEFIPSPVAVWLPFGGPAEIRSGDRLDVAWQIEPGAAGTEIRLFLIDEPDVIADFGVFGSATGAGVGQVALPLGLATKSSYTIKGVSILNGTLMNTTPPMTILFVPNAVRGGRWTRY